MSDVVQSAEDNDLRDDGGKLTRGWKSLTIREELSGLSEQLLRKDVPEANLQLVQECFEAREREVLLCPF